MRLKSVIASAIVGLSALVSSGCSTYMTRGEKWERDGSKWMVVPNVVGAYFGTVAVHEGAHALTAELQGADSVSVDVLPGKNDEGKYYLGYTEYKGKTFTGLEDTLFNVSGPAINGVAHLGFRAVLRSGYVPNVAQPTLAWLALGNKVAFYYQTIRGLAGDGDSDLGKEEKWISGVMLAGGLLIDILDFETDDNYLSVLVGERFYMPKHDSVDVMVAPEKGGFSFSLEFRH